MSYKGEGKMMKDVSRAVLFCILLLYSYYIYTIYYIIHNIIFIIIIL